MVLFQLLLVCWIGEEWYSRWTVGGDSVLIGDYVSNWVAEKKPPLQSDSDCIQQHIFVCLLVLLNRWVKSVTIDIKTWCNMLRPCIHCF